MVLLMTDTGTETVTMTVTPTVSPSSPLGTYVQHCNVMLHIHMYKCNSNMHNAFLSMHNA